MIYGISGRTGGGKSYEAVVSHIIPIVTQQKRKVVTNLPLNVDEICAVYGNECRALIDVIDGEFHNYGGQRPFSKKEHYLQYEDWQNESGLRVYFVVDECQLSIPQQGTDKELIQFFEMHRHYGFDILLITQNFRKVNRDIRDLVGNHYRAIKKSMMGQNDKYILKVHDGSSASNASVVATHEREYEKKYFKFYKSHTKSNVAIKEADSNDIKKWYDNWFFKGSVILFIIAFMMLYSNLSSERDDARLSKSEPENVYPDAYKPVNPNQYSQAQFSQNAQGAMQPLSAPVQTLGPRSDMGSSAPGFQSSGFQPSAFAQNDMYESQAIPKHPFYKVQLHISGWAEYTDVNTVRKEYHLSASQNGQYMFDLGMKDLFLAGYEVVVHSECMIHISYRNYSDFLTCDNPRILMDAPVIGSASDVASVDTFR